MTASKNDASTPPRHVHAGPHSSLDENYIQSKEHRYPISPLVIYVTDSRSDALVRIYDGEIAKRDNAFLVERKELVGKTPEEIQSLFGLTFVPRYLCDALIPVGHKVIHGKLTNEAGRRVSIYKAVTALELFSERILTPENIPPGRRKP